MAEPGSMCLAMNADKLQPKEHCASTPNRNFEGRQNGGRTHLVSPAMAAAAAIAGRFVDVRVLMNESTKANERKALVEGIQQNCPLKTQFDYASTNDVRGVHTILKNIPIA